MKRKQLQKLLPLDRLAVEELIREQSGSVGGVSLAKKKKNSDLPLFADPSEQTKLF